MRENVNSIVRQYAVNHGWDFRSAYNNLYEQFAKYTHTNLKLRAKRQKCRVIEVIDRMGQMALLEYFAKDLYTDSYKI